MKFLNLNKKFFLAIIFFFVLLLYACNQKKQANLEVDTTIKPNVIFILADDMGYSDISCFGSEIATPNIDSFAKSGTVFTNFYNTSRCSPSRASLLTGKYPHQVGMGMLAKEEKGEPGPYQGYLSKVPTIASLLKKQDYDTYMVGKWHLGQEKDNWPLQYGFDKYFGLLSGASSYFELIKNQPKTRLMVNNNELWEPKSNNFYMTSAISDTAVSYINRHKKNKPFFLYLSYTAPHWPLHALKEDITLFKDVYSEGWNKLSRERFERMKDLGLLNIEDVLPKMPETIPEWDSLTIKEQQNWERLMAVYAAMIYRMDYGIGEIVKALKEKGMYKNTIFMFASDNGADKSNISTRRSLNKNGELADYLNNPEIKPGLKGSYVSYLEPWARLSNTPYINYKRSAYWGGMRTPFLFFDARNSNKSSKKIITENTHLIDVLPTILDLTKSVDSKTKVEGKSLTQLFTTDSIVSFKDRPIFFEHEGSKAVIKNKWKLLKESNSKEWKLFNLDKNPFETVDVASKNPDIVNELKDLFVIWESRTNSYTHKKFK